LIEFAASFAKPLLHIYNSSILTGNVPTKLKIAKYKKVERTEPSYYRPISLLSIFSKLFEKIICRRLVSFLDRYYSIYEKNHGNDGFRKKHSTTLALIKVIDNIYKHLDEQEFVVGIYFDLQKAFDTVDHAIFNGLVGPL